MAPCQRDEEGAPPYISNQNLKKEANPKHTLFHGITNAVVKSPAIHVEGVSRSRRDPTGDMRARVRMSAGLPVLLHIFGLCG